MASQASSGDVSADPRSSCEGLILAGGTGRRLGQGPKHAVQLGSCTMLEHVERALRPQVSGWQLNAPRDAATVTHPCRVLEDPPDFAGQGPLAGILAGLQTASSRCLLCAPVDAVRLPPDLAQRLLLAVQIRQQPLAVAGDHYTCLLMDRDHTADLATQLLAYLRSGQRSIRGWLQQLPLCRVDWPDEGWIWSLNTPRELAAAHASMTQ